jgi:hypothetical protein
VEEIDQADKAGNLSEFATWKESNNLPYLQACIKEALSTVDIQPKLHVSKR